MFHAVKVTRGNVRFLPKADISEDLIRLYERTASCPLGRRYQRRRNTNGRSNLGSRFYRKLGIDGSKATQKGPWLLSQGPSSIGLAIGEGQ